VRRPQEPLSQRRLLAELRRAIDLGRADLALLLADTHPRATVSPYVTHNLGQARVRLLASWMRAARSLEFVP
jgi:hypothetical protein